MYNMISDIIVPVFPDRFPHFTMHCKLLDTHLYIIQHWLLDYLSEQKSISSIKGELIPHLVRRQGVLGQQTKSEHMNLQVYMKGDLLTYYSILFQHLCI